MIVAKNGKFATFESAGARSRYGTMVDYDDFDREAEVVRFLEVCILI